MVLCIVALHHDRWRVCEVPVLVPYSSPDKVDLVMGLQRFSFSKPVSGWTDDDLCGDQFIAVFTDNMCDVGKSTHALGIVAAIAMGGAIALGLAIAATRSRRIMWTLAITAHVLGGVLAISAGSNYTTKDDPRAMSTCEGTATGPSLMIGGRCSAHTQCSEPITGSTTDERACVIDRRTHVPLCLFLCVSVSRWRGVPPGLLSLLLLLLSS